MSFQRAYVNCMRCHTLAENEGGVEECIEFNRYGNDSLYTARNEAMKALEEMIRNIHDVKENLPKYDSPDDLIHRRSILMRTAFSCLDACVACDYSKPAIANYIKKNVWKKKTAK